MNKRKILFYFACIAILVFAVYSYLFREHRDISQEEAQYDLTAVALSTAFTEDHKTATDKYLNQTLLVRGSITEIEPEALILNNRVYITFNQSTNKSFDLGTIVDVKGRCIGYDELLEWVKLDQAIVIK